MLKLVLSREIGMHRLMLRMIFENASFLVRYLCNFLLKMEIAKTPRL